MTAIGGAMALCLFCYLGVETAAVAAAKVRDPDKNVPRATIFGTLGTAVVYLLSLIAVFGIVSAAALSESTAPFATAVNAIFGGTWAGYVMSALVVISGFGALNGWTMICAEMPLAAAKDGLFPRAFGEAQPPRRPGVRHHLLHRPRVGLHDHVLRRLGRHHGVQHPGLHVRASPPRSPTRSPRSRRSSGGWWTTGSCRRRGSCATSAIAVVGLVFSVLFIVYSRNTGEDTLWKQYLPFIFAGIAFLAGIPIYLRHRTSDDRAARPSRPGSPDASSRRRSTP